MTANSREILTCLFYIGANFLYGQDFGDVLVAGFDNMESLEGTATAPAELILSVRSKKITLTNDHATEVFKFKFNAASDYSTLMAGETLSFGFRTQSIWVDGDSVPYRIWVFT